MAWERTGEKLVPAVGIHFDHPPRMAERGRVIMGRKGEKRTGQSGKVYRLPEKLDHFELVMTEKDAETDQFLPDRSAQQSYNEFMESIGVLLEKAKDGKTIIKEVPIFFIRDDVDEVFISFYALYAGSMWWCRGVGVNDPDGSDRNAIRRHKNGEGRYREERWKQKSQWGPCGKNCPEYQTGKCKQHGILQFAYAFAPEFGGVYQFRTTGSNTIANIVTALNEIKMLTGGMLAWVPELYLTYQRRQVVDREGKTHRIPVATVLLKKKVAEINNFLGSVYNLRIKAQEARAMSFHTVKPIGTALTSLPPAATGDETEEEIQDVVAEFVPDMPEPPQNGEPFEAVQVKNPEAFSLDPEEVAETLLMEYGNIDGVILACKENDGVIPIEPEVLVKVAVRLQLLDEKKAEAKLTELRGLESEEETWEAPVGLVQEESPILQPPPPSSAPAPTTAKTASLPRTSARVRLCDGCGAKLDPVKKSLYALNGKILCGKCFEATKSPQREPGDAEAMKRTAEPAEPDAEPDDSQSDLYFCAACGEMIDSASPKGGTVAGEATLCGKCAKREGTASKLAEEPGQMSLESTLPPEKKKRGRPPKNRLA